MDPLVLHKTIKLKIKMNKGDFLRYIVLHCCKSVLITNDCIKAFCAVFETSRVCRNLFTWETRHFKELMGNSRFVPLTQHGDVYFICAYKHAGDMILHTNPSHFIETSEDEKRHIYRTSIYRDLTNDVHKEFSFFTSDGIFTMTKEVRVQPEVVKEKIIK